MGGERSLATGLGTALVASPAQSRVPNQSVDSVEIEVDAAWRGTTPVDGSLLVDRVYGETTASAPNVGIRDEQDGWTDIENRRFEELAVAEAIGDLTEDEAFELETLTRERRAAQQPRSADEVLWEFEQRRLTAELLETLSRYVEFYEGADQARSGAGQTSHRR